MSVVCTHRAATTKLKTKQRRKRGKSKTERNGVLSRANCECKRVIGAKIRSRVVRVVRARHTLGARAMRAGHARRPCERAICRESTRTTANYGVSSYSPLTTLLEHYSPRSSSNLRHCTFKSQSQLEQRLSIQSELLGCVCGCVWACVCV